VTAGLDRKWIMAGRQAALLLLLVALFQAKEEVFEELLGVHYQPLWAAVHESAHSALL